MIFDFFVVVWCCLLPQSPNFLQTIPLGESEINKGIIGTISDADTPQTPSTRGYTDMLRYLVGETDEHRQRWRDEVLSTKEEDFRRFGDKLEAFHAGQPKVVVVGGTGSVEEMKGNEAWRVKRL
jgi:Zn-dependent M16 (insulinase) family peptidase